MISTCHDPWVIPHPDQIDSFCDVMSLRPLEKAYQVVLSFVETFEIHDHFSMGLNAYSHYPWLGSWDSPDHLNETFQTHESIIQFISLK